jgi:zinc/manganese transport system permease protein
MGPVAHIAFLLLAVLNLIAGFHAIGTLMAVGIMILPAITARYWTNRLSHLLMISVVLAMFSSLAGLLVSYHLGWPTSPAIILTLGVCYFLSIIAGHRSGLLWRYVRRAHLQA